MIMTEKTMLTLSIVVCIALCVMNVLLAIYNAGSWLMYLNGGAAVIVISAAGYAIYALRDLT